MHFTRLAVLAAALNLAIGSPILSKKSRDIIASDIAKRALEPIPGSTTLDKRNGYGYVDTPRPSREEKRNAAAMAYNYVDTPRPSMEEKRDAAAMAYDYVDTPRPSMEEKRNAAAAAYKYVDTPRPSMEEKR